LTLVPGSLAFSLELIATGAQLRNGLLREKLLECPLFNILLFVFLELGDELDSALQDGALVLLAAWDDFGQLVDALVDGLSSAAFDWVSLVTANRQESKYTPSL
jgi:hypothetical protein